MTLRIVTMLWDANANSFDFSRCYDEAWVARLFDGFSRNLTIPHQFVLFTDRRRDLGGRDVLQILTCGAQPSYGSFIEPFRLNDPMILVGLDTVITGNIDHLAEYCLDASMMALPIDPFHPTTVCNGVALVPAGQRDVFDRWGGGNDMEWLRAQQYKTIDALFPGQVVSYKGCAKGYGIRDARIVYFHGDEKPHQLAQVDWINAHWRANDEAPRESVPQEFVSSTLQKIEVLCNTPEAIYFANIKRNAKRYHLPWLVALPENVGVCVIVGGGPSLKRDLEIVRAHAGAGHQIIALNNTACFLRNNGIIPDVQFVMDARPKNVRFVESRPAKSYILSSQCDPSLFDSLAGADVTVMHPAIEGIYDHIPHTATVLTATPTAGIGALSVAYTLGYREIHLYGYDSSDADDGTAHAYAQDENDPEKRRIEVWCEGRKFRCSYAMYAQAEKFQSFARMLADADATIHVHGDGLLPTIAHAMTKGEHQ